MQVSEIRPRSTYMGHGGLIRRAQSIQMDGDGVLRVAWKAVRLPRDAKDRSTSGFTGSAPANRQGGGGASPLQ